MGVPVGFTYFYLFAEDFGMGAVRTAGRSATPAAAGTRVDTKVSTLVPTAVGTANHRAKFWLSFLLRRIPL